MNFHKTIGFLATLLLVLGFGVPDSFAQTSGTTELTLSRSRSVTEGSSVKVTVTVKPAPLSGSTVTVSVTATPSPDGSNTAEEGFQLTLDPDEDPVTVLGTTTVDIEVVGPAATATSDAIFVVDDELFHDNGMITFSAAEATTGDTTYAAIAAEDGKKLSIRENDDSTGALTLTAVPSSYSVDVGGDVILTVKIAEAAEADLEVSFTAITDPTAADATPATITINAATIAEDAKEATATATLPVGDAVEGVLNVTATAVGYESAMIKLPIISRDAEDVEGFRVTIAKPADGAWVGQGNKKVHVHVTRVNNTQSFPWMSFSSLAITLRDTAVSDHNIISVVANNFSNQSGNISFNKTVFGSGVDPATGTALTETTDGVNPADAANKISYVQADDKFIFEIQLPNTTPAAVDVTTVLSTLTGEETGDGTATDPAPDDAHPQAGLTAKAQRMGVYAVATFTPPGAPRGVLNSNDVKKKVFSNPATSGADQTVGDGKHIKIDLLAPDNIADNINVTLNNDKMPVEDETEAKIGDVIKVAVGIDARTRFIRDGGMQIQISTKKNTDASGNANALTLEKMDFNQAQISAAAGDSLRTSVTLTSGLFRNKASADGHTRDGVELKKNVVFEPDYVTLSALVKTKDQAGNFSSAVAQELIGDTREPGISVLYPADGGRLTGAIGDTDFDKFLKPLQVRVDEDLDSLYVHVDGAIVGKLGDDDNASGKIILWSEEDRNQDLSKIVKRKMGESVGDTIVYDTRGLKWKNAKGELKATGQGGTEVDLVVVAVDKVGNVSREILEGVFHDEKPPTITDWFPKRSLLEGDNYQINEATRHPVITLKEAVDSLSVTYDPETGENIVEKRGGLSKGDHQVMFAKPFVHDRVYSLTIFARDLAGNAFMTERDDAADLRFNQQFDNPQANMFTMKNISPAKSDSVVAGQALYLEIQAVDKDANSNTKRNALTYKNDMASEVRISAWDMATGGVAESVMFHGGGVAPSSMGDGYAMLDANGWKLGKRTVYAKSNKALDLIKIVVEHLNAGEGGTSVKAFDGEIDSLTVDAADFAGFELTAWEDGVEGEAQEVWGDFTLRVVPVDKFGNPSVKAYKAAPSKGNNDVENEAAIEAAEDSLNVLDTRLKDNGYNYKNGIDVTLRSLPAIGLPPFEWTIELAGESFPVTAPSNARQVSVQVRIDNTSVNTDDERSKNVKTSKSFKVSAPITPMLTLWVPGSDMDEAGNDVVIPADAADGIMVTVAAEGYNAGDMVTFTKNGTATDPVAANDDGVAKLMITMAAAGTVTVSATNGVYSTDELTIVFTETPPEPEPARKSYADKDGMPVYLVYAGDAPPNMTVGVDDFLALVAAFGSSDGDDNYNAQADVDDSGTVDVDDFLEFVMSFGRTASGPATKPLVLLPGINENAEFSLSLGSERVVAGELVAVDVSLANVAALIGYGFALNYETDKFEFISVAPADEDLLKSTGGETLFHHIVSDGQITVANGLYNGTAVSGGGDAVRFVFRVLREFEDNARFEVADGLVFDPSQLSNPAVVAGVLELQSTPREFALHQNFPNPFNPDTTIKYDLAESADVTLQIYNVLGQVVRTLVASEAQNAGRYQIRWNGMDDRGVPVSSGIYFYQISADGKFSDVRKLMLLK